MPTDIRIVKPYLRRNMENPKLHGHDNLCSTIRDIYMKCDDEEIKLWCRIAMRMSKNMYKALVVYKEMLMEAGYGEVDKHRREEWQLTQLEKSGKTR